MSAFLQKQTGAEIYDGPLGRVTKQEFTLLGLRGRTDLIRSVSLGTAGVEPPVMPWKYRWVFWAVGSLAGAALVAGLWRDVVPGGVSLFLFGLAFTLGVVGFVMQNAWNAEQEQVVRPEPNEVVVECVSSWALPVREVGRVVRVRGSVPGELGDYLRENRWVRVYLTGLSAVEARELYGALHEWLQRKASD